LITEKASEDNQWKESPEELPVPAWIRDRTFYSEYSGVTTQAKETEQSIGEIAANQAIWQPRDWL
jgi:hypothetical protein